MKKSILLILLLFTSLFSTAQTLCDSVDYAISNPGSGVLTLHGDLNIPSGVTIDSIIWAWQACDEFTCYTSGDSIAIFSDLQTSDTIYVLLSVVIIANGDTCYGNVPKIYYIHGTNGWEFFSSEPTFISELQSPSKMLNNRIFDLFGREYTTLKLNSPGAMYIQNGKKYIKIK